jgi:opacity protein-like surface antigen
MHKTMISAILAGSLLACTSCPGRADGLPDRRRVQKFDPIETTFQATAYGYAGLLAGWGRADLEGDLLDGHDSGFVWGGFAGYMIRPNQVFAFGVEVDYVRTNFREVAVAPQCCLEFLKSDWNASGRLRVGFFPVQTIAAMVYVTGGAAWSDRADGMGGVYGAGVEMDMTKNVALRLEVLQYRFSGEAGDQTIGRLGVAFKFQ